MREASSPPRPAHSAESRCSQTDCHGSKLCVQIPARPPRASTAPVSGSSPRVCTAQLAKNAVWTDRQTDRQTERFSYQTSASSYVPQRPHSSARTARLSPVRSLRGEWSLASRFCSIGRFGSVLAALICRNARCVSPPASAAFRNAWCVSPPASLAFQNVRWASAPASAAFQNARCASAPASAAFQNAWCVSPPASLAFRNGWCVSPPCISANFCLQGARKQAPRSNPLFAAICAEHGLAEELDAHRLRKACWCA